MLKKIIIVSLCLSYILAQNIEVVKVVGEGFTAQCEKDYKAVGCSCPLNSQYKLVADNTCQCTESSSEIKAQVQCVKITDSDNEIVPFNVIVSGPNDSGRQSCPAGMTAVSCSCESNSQGPCNSWQVEGENYETCSCNCGQTNVYAHCIEIEEKYSIACEYAFASQAESMCYDSAQYLFSCSCGNECNAWDFTNSNSDNNAACQCNNECGSDWSGAQCCKFKNSFLQIGSAPAQENNYNSLPPAGEQMEKIPDSGSHEEQQPEEECIVIYSECDYKGQSANICQDNNDLHKNVGFKAKSIKIPSGFQVTVYEDPEYSGKKMTLQEDHACFMNEQFNLVSIKYQRIFDKGHLKHNQK